MDIYSEDIIRKYKRVPMDNMFNLLVESKQNFYVRKGSECNEIIFDVNHNIYTTKKKNFPNNKIFLFNLVQRDARKFLAFNPFIELPPKKDVSFYNYSYDHKKGTITGTDLNHAYWRIAYVKGYITKKTYDYGLDETAKPLRLATLSVLGREKKFDYYENGILKETIVMKPKDEQLRKVYQDIRLSCFYMMYEISLLLKDDFDCWKTDGIFYRDTPENRTLVRGYFEEREMLFKQLVFN